MLGCVNINNPEFQILKNKSGLSDFQLSVYWRMYQDKYGITPKLDELPGVNSIPSFTDYVQLRKDGTAKVEHLQQITGKETPQEINAELNKEYLDLEVDVLPLGKDAIVNVRQRPTNFGVNPISVGKVDRNVNSKVFLNQMIDKLGSVYGIKINPITISLLNSKEWKGLVTDAKNTNGFIYNGEIYINTDIASVDTPLHELMHLLVGSMRFSNPEVYSKLIMEAENFPTYQTLVLNYENRTRNDINEEIFVTEFSKFMTGEESALNNLTPGEIHLLMYNICRTLDSILMGEGSVKSILPQELMSMSLKDVAEKVNSTVMQSIHLGTLDSSAEHRILQNQKSLLMKDNKLEEICL